jgi:hypothetical protein
MHNQQSYRVRGGLISVFIKRYQKRVNLFRWRDMGAAE